MIYRLYRRLRNRTCKVCGREFRKAKPKMPSLVGFSYCSKACEGAAWESWKKEVGL